MNDEYEEGKVKWLMVVMGFSHIQAKSIVKAKAFYKVKQAYEKLTDSN